MRSTKNKKLTLGKKDKNACKWWLKTAPAEQTVNKDLDAEFSRCVGLIDGAHWAEFRATVEAYPGLARAVDPDRNTLLFVAARRGEAIEGIRVLLDAGADINHRGYLRQNVIAETIEGGSDISINTVDELRYLVSRGANIRDFAWGEYPALHFSILRVRYLHARLLLELGADPEQTTSDSTFPETARAVAKRMYATRALALLDEFSHAQRV